MEPPRSLNKKWRMDLRSVGIVLPVDLSVMRKVLPVKLQLVHIALWSIVLFRTTSWAADTEISLHQRVFDSVGAVVIFEQPATFCSGVLIAPGMVITAGHCVKEYGTFGVIFNTSERLYMAKVLRYSWMDQIPYKTSINSSAGADIVILHLDAEIPIQPMQLAGAMQLASSYGLTVNDLLPSTNRAPSPAFSLHTAGFPNDNTANLIERVSLSNGTVTWWDKDRRSTEFLEPLGYQKRCFIIGDVDMTQINLETDCLAREGYSGGPAMIVNGGIAYLVGIISSGTQGQESLTSLNSSRTRMVNLVNVEIREWISSVIRGYR